MVTIGLLREAIPYIQRFNGKTFVIKLGGRIAGDDDAMATLVQDMVLLHLVGINIVVIHGGGSQATDLLNELNHESRFINGRRVTDEKSLDVAKMVYGGKINIELVSAFRRAGARAVGLSGADGGLISAERRPIQRVFNRETESYEDVDYGHVGDIVQINTGILTDLIGGKYIPVISCLGSDDEGNIYNINADTMAQNIAVGLGATKLISITDVPGIMRDPNDPNSIISYLTVEDAKALIEEGIVKGGMIPKVNTCINAVEKGVERAALINGKDRDSLLTEIFTNRGHGTLIARETELAEYRQAELGT